MVEPRPNLASVKITRARLGFHLRGLFFRGFTETAQVTLVGSSSKLSVPSSSAITVSCDRARSEPKPEADRLARAKREAGHTLRSKGKPIVSLFPCRIVGRVATPRRCARSALDQPRCDMHLPARRIHPDRNATLRRSRPGPGNFFPPKAVASHLRSPSWIAAPTSEHARRRCGRHHLTATVFADLQSPPSRSTPTPPPRRPLPPR